MRSVCFVAAVTSLVAAAPSDSDACSPAPCRPGFFTPGNAATVPANLSTFYWKPVSSVLSTPLPGPSDVLFARAAAPTTPLPFTATKLPDSSYLITPQDPLTPGTDYILTDQYKCAGTSVGPSSMFRAANAAPQPTSLGTLVETANLTAPLTVSSSSGACTADVTAHQIQIALTPSADALAWRYALQYETLVDGRLWSASNSAASSVSPGASGRGTDLLYALCKTEDAHASEGLAAGPHEVVMRATLPGTTTVVQSSPLTVQLECVDDGRSDSDDAGGCAASGTGGARWLSLVPLAALLGLGRRRAARRVR